jgi:hypothetical protein
MATSSWFLKAGLEFGFISVVAPTGSPLYRGLATRLR